MSGTTLNMPVFQIQVRGRADDGRQEFRVKLSLPHVDRFHVRSAVVTFQAFGGLDALMTDIEIRPREVSVVIYERISAPEGSKPAVRGIVATLTPTAEQDVDAKDPFFVKLSNEVDSAWGDAVFAADAAPVQSVPATFGMPAAAAPAGAYAAPAALRAAVPVTGWRASLGVFVPRTPKAWAVTAVVLIALTLIALGAVRQLRGTQEPNDLALADGADPALTAKIKGEIDQAIKNPNSVQGYNGMNVALATMHAMGLDPGKANTGCLVGLGKK
jgi:hypothetical protein